MNYHIARDGTQLGTFDNSQLQQGLANGTLRGTDLAWCEGMADWAALSTIQPAPAPVTAPPLPPSLPTALPGAVPQMIVQSGTSGIAITSLVLGLMSLLFSCITGVPAIICGVVALIKIGKSGGELGGKGLAITGLVLGAISILILPILAALAIPAMNQVQEKARMIQSSNNARQIVIAMKSYAADQNGRYPEAATSNDAFRELFKAGLIENETYFTAPDSPYVGDGNIGEAPEFSEALKPGENHWALTKGLTDSASGNAPLVFENPVPGGEWPPAWSADKSGSATAGRAWKSGKIIVGRNDGSVASEILESMRGARVPLKKYAEGKDLFTLFAEQGEYMDIAR